MCIPNGPTEPMRFGKVRSLPYGIEMILDLYDCNPRFFTRMWLTVFVEKLCKKIDMEREDLHFWDYEGTPEEEKRKLPAHLEGISGIQFIRTSNITMHTLNQPRMVLLNIFSCKDFNVKEALLFCQQFFETDDFTYKMVDRGKCWRKYLERDKDG